MYRSNLFPHEDGDKTVDLEFRNWQIPRLFTDLYTFPTILQIKGEDRKDINRIFLISQP